MKRFLSTAKMVLAPTVKLNNGYEMPVLGLGTYLAKNREGVEAIKTAVDAGYRHFDTAYFYGNEKEVGEALRAKIAEGKVKREDLFVVTKLWNCFHDPAHVETAFKKSMENLNLEYIDLYLMHMPIGYEFRGYEKDLFPTDKDGNLCFSDVDYKYGKTSGQVILKYLIQELGVVPIPKSANSERIKQNIDIFDFTLSPEDCQYLESLNCNHRSNPFLFTNTIHSMRNFKSTEAAFSFKKTVKMVAKIPTVKLNNGKEMPILGLGTWKEVAQVLIRYQIEKGNIVIPKSVTKSRIISNANVFDFQLSKEDIAAIDALDCNGRFVPLTNVNDHKDYPFNEEF
uniref:CSON005707 protein n=1 Tax=Culicoides sonorensis TaxID=179676 RepID=A0A336L6J0_CULSO